MELAIRPSTRFHRALRALALTPQALGPRNRDPAPGVYPRDEPGVTGAVFDPEAAGQSGKTASARTRIRRSGGTVRGAGQAGQRERLNFGTCPVSRVAYLARGSFSSLEFFETKIPAKI